MQQVTRRTLSEGVALTCVTTPRFKRSVLRAVLLLPLGGENAALRACLPQVLRRGTAEYTNLNALGAALDELYGARIESAVRKEGENLCIGFLADCIDEACVPDADGLTAQLVRLLASLLTEPYLPGGGFSADYVEGEKNALCDRIAALRNDPRSWAVRRLTALMCDSERYGASAFGTVENAREITAEKLFAAWREALSTAKIELFYCGTHTPDEIEAMWRETPLAAPRPGAIYQPHTEVLASPASAPREIIEEEQVTQGKLSLGFRTGGASLTGGEPAAYWMFQTIYGGSTSAKLFLNVREKKSLCYYASAQFVASKGLMIVGSGIENRNFEVARDEILHQLDLCRKGEITDAELESARKTLVNGWRTMLDDPLTLERYWMGQAAAGTLVSPEERIEQVADITREQVIAAAQSTALDTVFFMKGAAK